MDPHETAIAYETPSSAKRTRHLRRSCIDRYFRVVLVSAGRAPESRAQMRQRGATRQGGRSHLFPLRGAACKAGGNTLGARRSSVWPSQRLPTICAWASRSRFARLPFWYARGLGVAASGALSLRVSRSVVGGAGLEPGTGPPAGECGLPWTCLDDPGVACGPEVEPESHHRPQVSPTS